MKPLRLEILGFLSYSEPMELDLSELSAAVILGDNGAGKTSIVEAMGWALFGKGRGRSVDDFVSTGVDSCRVSFEFSIEGQTYRVERQRSSSKSGRSTLQLFQATPPIADPLAIQVRPGWIPFGGQTVAEIQADIENLVGLDYDTWLATSFVGQGRADAFTQLRPAERKQLLFDVLQLENYQVLADAAKAREKEASGKLGALADESVRLTSAGTIVDEAAVLTASDLKRRAEEALAEADEARQLARDQSALASREVETFDERRRARAEFDREIRGAREEIPITEAQMEKVTQAERTIETIRGDLAILQAAETVLLGDVEGLTEQLNERREGIARLKAEAQSFEPLMAEARLRLATLEAHDEAVCFTCGQELGARRESIIDELGRKITASEQSMAEVLARAEADSRISLETTVALKTKQGEASDLSFKAENHRRALATAEAAIAGKEAAGASVERAKERLVRLEEREGLMAPVDEAARTQAQVSADHFRATVNETDATYQRCVQAAQQAAADLARIEADLAASVARRARLDELAAEIAQVDEDLELYGVLSGAFGRDGIPTLILENAIPQIETSANDWLSRFTEGRFSLHLESQRAKKTGGLKETLDVLVVADSSERSLEELSGGERQCVDLALRLGIAQLLAHRAGTKIGTLILDEAFTALDNGRRQRAIEIIHALTDEFDLVLFITHQTELAQAFGARIEVERSEHGSHAEVVAA